jgi:hypothetical protein
MSFYPKFYLDKIWINKHGQGHHLGKTGALKNGNFFLLFFPNEKKIMLKLMVSFNLGGLSSSADQYFSTYD